MTDDHIDQRVHSIRRFNRFYTRQIGVLQQGFLGSAFSLTEVRVLYELAHRDNLTATELAKDLGLDAGYLSRMLRDFEHRAYAKKTPSQNDGRQSILSLTRRGRKAFEPLNRRQHEEIVILLKTMSAAEQDRLIDAMHAIEGLLGASPEKGSSLIIRPHQPGDMGWIVHRHGVLYGQEYGWDEQFEALVAEIVAKFLKEFDPKRERCWIAERDDEIVGSVFLVKKSEKIAQLRLLLVEPSARGLGIGHRLVSECIRFARQSRYKKIVLWTNDVLQAARRVYEQAGFHLTREDRHHSFGKDLVGQYWELVL